jgi:hypothetical protein
MDSDEQDASRRSRLAMMRQILVLYNDIIIPDSLADNEPELPREIRTRNRRPRVDYWDSCWGRMLLDPDITDPSTRSAKQFRRRFRTPYPIYFELVRLSQEFNLFNVRDEDAFGHTGVPTELKVLCFLRVVGRAWC